MYWHEVDPRVSPRFNVLTRGGSTCLLDILGIVKTRKIHREKNTQDSPMIFYTHGLYPCPVLQHVRRPNGRILRVLERIFYWILGIRWFLLSTVRWMQSKGLQMFTQSPLWPYWQRLNQVQRLVLEWRITSRAYLRVLWPNSVWWSWLLESLLPEVLCLYQPNQEDKTLWFSR